MKTYEITVNDKVYIVKAKEIDAETVSAHESSKPLPVPEPIKPAPVSVSTGKGEKVFSPMPGKILEVSVQKGDQVKKGQKLVVLEAMKMENEIISPEDGVVSGIYVKKGDQVETGALIIEL